MPNEHRNTFVMFVISVLCVNDNGNNDKSAPVVSYNQSLLQIIARRTKALHTTVLVCSVIFQFIPIYLSKRKG